MSDVIDLVAAKQLAASARSGDRKAIGDLLTFLSGSVYGRILAQSGLGASHTGDTDETSLTTVPVPALLLNDSLLIHAVWSCTNSGNDKTFRTRFGPAGAAVTHAGVAYSNLTYTSIATYAEIRKITNRNSAASQVGMPAGLSSGLGASSGALVTSAIDTTAASEIEFSAQLANAGETITLESYLVELISS